MASLMVYLLESVEMSASGKGMVTLLTDVAVAYCAWLSTIIERLDKIGIKYFGYGASKC